MSQGSGSNVPTMASAPPMTPPAAMQNPLTQNPMVMAQNPLVVGGPEIAPVSNQLPTPISSQLPNVTSTPNPIDQMARAQAPPGQGAGASAASMAGNNANAAMQAAIAGRPVAPSLGSVTGASGAAPGASAAAQGSAGLNQLIQSMDPDTVSSILKILAA